MRKLGIIIALLLLLTLVACGSSTPALVTHDCTDRATDSLRAQGEVKDIGAGLLSKRGFVWLEGDSGDSELNLIPLVNPSFEEGAGVPTGWAKIGSSSVSQSGDSVFGDNSTEIERMHSSEPRVLGTDPGNTASASEGETFSAWGMCKRVSGTGNGGFRLEFYDSGGTRLSLVTGNAYKGTDWGVIQVTGTAPADTVWARLRLRIGTRYDVFRFDGIMFVKGSQLLAVFEDGEFSTGTYSLTIEDLEPDTSYRVQAFGENEAGIGYGNTVTGKTLAAT